MTSAARRDSTMVIAAAVASGIGAYVFQAIGTRALGDVGYAPISVLLTIQYLALTVALYPIETFISRSVTRSGRSSTRANGGVFGLRIWVLSTAAVVAIGAAVWHENLFGRSYGDFAIIATITVVAYGAFMALKGRLAGSERFGGYAIATALESLGRVAVTIPVIAISNTPRAVAWMLPVGPILVLVWALGRRTPNAKADGEEGDIGPPPSAAAYLAATTLSNAVLQVLLAGGTLVLVLLDATASDVSVFFITTTAARVPLVLAFGSLVPRVLPPLTRLAMAGQMNDLHRRAALTGLAAFALAAVGAAIAFMVGPELIAALFGTAFRPPNWLAALAAGGVVLATGALALNQWLIATGMEGRLILPWAIALTVGGLAVVAVPGGAMARVAIASTTGEAVALSGVLITALLARSAQRPTAPASGEHPLGPVHPP